MQARLWLFYYCGAFGVRLDYFLLFLLFGVAMWSSWCLLSHDLVVAVNSEAFLDLLLSTLALLLLSPLLAAISCAIVASSGWPVMYWSIRAGKNQRPFFMPKFRTMHTSAPVVASNNLDSAKNHITSVGSFLRKTSLDELPQLYSVFWAHECSWPTASTCYRKRTYKPAGTFRRLCFKAWHNRVGSDKRS